MPGAGPGDARDRQAAGVGLAGRSGNWRTLRPRDGETHVTDGPYTEAKEIVGGLFIIEADSQEEALRIAAMHPAARIGEAGGWAVELIPLEFYLAL